MARKSWHLVTLSNGRERQYYDPLGSVIAYLRNERWDESHARNEAERIYSLVGAIEICCDVYNSRYQAAA